MPGIRLNRTIDGEPVPSAAAAPVSPQATPHLRKRLHADGYLWGIYILLLIFSVIELYSASSTEVKSDNVYSPLISHATFLVAGLALVLVMQNIHYKFFRKCAWLFMWFAVGLVIYSNYFGININGAIRAIRVAGFTVQPPEIAKLAVVLVLAKIMAKHQMRHGVTNLGIVLSVMVIGLFAGLLFRNGLTNTLLLGSVGAAMFVIGGTQWRKLLVLAVGAACVGMAVYMVKYSGSEEADDGGTATSMVASAPDADRSPDRTGTHKGRISAFLAGVDPEDSITDENRQVIFSKIAQAHGGVLGNVPGNSRESARLPLAFSDYIFSIIVEDTGFVGGVILLILYLCLLARAGIIATKCSKAFPALLITGCATLIVTQALIHMFIVTGLMPVSGQPLPFISKGGTSIIVMSAAMGMMLSVSKFAVQQRRNADKNQAIKEALSDKDDNTVNPTQLTYASLPEE